jgi:hypothetical protein
VIDGAVVDHYYFDASFEQNVVCLAGLRASIEPPPILKRACDVSNDRFVARKNYE